MSPTAAAPGRAGPEELAEPTAAVGDSLSVAVWTLVSRLTGLLRGVVVAAVLGATHLANTYQFLNALPNLVFYGFLAGALFSSLLVPALVRHLDAADGPAASRVAGGLFGTVALLMVVIVPVVVLAAPWVLEAAGPGGPDAAAQARVAGLLVLMLMPQVPLYAVIGTATAVMNAQRRFALAAAAPALENLGTIAVLGTVVLRYPHPGTLADAPGGLLVLLGLGTTGSVALHAAVQWWGARRSGVTVLPRPGWRDPEVRALLRRAGTAVVQAALAAVQLVVLLALADRVVGGVVAFQLALNFYFLPIALAATPVALSLAPRLARMLGDGEAAAFRDTYVRGLAFVLFLTVPATVGYLCLAPTLSTAISLGAFRQGGGEGLVAAALLGLGAGIVGEAVFLVSTYACYARGDTRTPLAAMAVQTAVCLAVAPAVLTVTGPAALTVLGAALAGGSVTGAVLLTRTVLRRSAPAEARLLPSLLRTLLAATAMALPVRAVPRALDAWALPAGPVPAAVAAAVAGAAVYFAAQAALRAPEVGWVKDAVGTRLAGTRRRLPRSGWSPGSGRPAALARGAPARGPVPALGPVCRNLAVQAVLLGLCAGLGVLVSVRAVAALAVLAAATGAVLLWRHPHWAAYLLVGVTPLVAGIDRGTVLPVVRPNEALLFALAGLLGLRWVVTARRGDLGRLRLSGVDLSLLAFASCSSVVPLLMMVARGRQIIGDDLNHAVVVWKLVLLYGVVRLTVTTTRQVMRCLVISLVAGGIVSAVGVLQALGLLGVPRLLARFYAPFGVDSALAIGRGSSTLSLPAAVADLAILNLVIALTLLAERRGPRGLLVASAVFSVLGVVAAAEFSTLIGMVVALVAFVLVTGQRRLLLQAAPVAVVAWFLLEPVIATRLSGFQSASGLPVSWIGRLRNLRTYFWPQIAADWNWVLGVRPQARVASSAQEFGWIWIESGYTWLLWGGGLPLLGSYVAVVVVAVRAARRVPQASPALAVVATTVVCALSADVFTMIFDPHITYRGAADALFGLLALTRAIPGEPPDPSPRRSHRDPITAPARPAPRGERAARA